MKINGNTGIGNFLKLLLEICMVIGTILLVLLIPILTSLKIEINFFTLLFYPCGVCFLILVYQFIGLFNSLKENQPFCKENIERLKLAMWMSFIISIIIIVALLSACVIKINYTSALKLCLGFLGILFGGVGIALYILSELFKTALTYKEENELTI